MHPSIKYTIESSQIFNNKEQSISFLDVNIILTKINTIKTDIYYKRTNSHEYLNYHTHHPKHVKDNIPYNLPKRIVVFVSCYEKTLYRLQELKEWLLQCNYLENIINAQLQGPAPLKQEKKVIPFVSTYYSNYSNKNVAEKAKALLKASTNEEIKEIFQHYNIIFAQKQPPNL